jgi:hypothetical protein
MEMTLIFIEISFIVRDNNNPEVPMDKKDFYSWLMKNSSTTIVSIPRLQYKINEDDYYFRLERDKSRTLQCWHVFVTYSKSMIKVDPFLFEYKQGHDFITNFETRLKEELEHK